MSLTLASLWQVLISNTFLPFFGTIRHKTMCISKDKDRRKAISAFCWKKSRWKLRRVPSYCPNHCQLFFLGAPGQGHVIKLSQVIVCPWRPSVKSRTRHIPCFFFRLSILRLPRVHLHFPSITCSGITCSPYLDSVLCRFAGHILLESTSSSEWNQALIYSYVWARVVHQRETLNQQIPDVMDCNQLVSLTSTCSCVLVVKSRFEIEFLQGHNGLKNRMTSFSIPQTCQGLIAWAINARKKDQNNKSFKLCPIYIIPLTSADSVWP